MTMKMSKKVTVRVTNDGPRGFFGRAREHAQKLDRGEKLASDIMLILSPQRIRVLEFAKKKRSATGVSALASGLKRDTRAVSRDVELLEQYGLLRTRYEANPGHGTRRIVEPCAEKYQLIATV